MQSFYLHCCIHVNQTRTWDNCEIVTLSTGDIPPAPASLHWKRGAVVFTFVSIMSSMESVILTQVSVLMNSSVNANAAV